MEWDDDYDQTYDQLFEDRAAIKPCNSKKKKTKFAVGDIVRLKAGKAKLRVTRVDANMLHATYVDSGRTQWRKQTDYVRITDTENFTPGSEKMKGKLFQTKETPVRYGVGLAVNAQGKYVLEMKDTAQYEPFEKKDVELVMPFTFGVQFTTGSTVYSYLGKESEVQVGDMLVTASDRGFSVGRVTAVDTKCEKATKHFEGSKLVTVPLGK